MNDGVLAYAVAQRRREIGVRMALGAVPKQIGNQFLSLGLRLLGAGTILGVIGAWLGRACDAEHPLRRPNSPRRDTCRHNRHHDCGFSSRLLAARPPYGQGRSDGGAPVRMTNVEMLNHTDPTQ